MDKARKLMEQGLYYLVSVKMPDFALKYFNELLNLNPHCAEAYFYRGLCHYYDGEYDKAINDFTKAIGLKPDYAEAYVQRASVYKSKKEYDKAFIDYTMAIRINPNHARAMALLGDLFHQKREYDKALYWYDQAFEKKEYLTFDDIETLLISLRNLREDMEKGG